MATPKILIVEDEAVTRNTLKGIFEAEGYEVLQAQDGAEMYRQLNSETVNLIVLDINLPGKNGLLLGRELREKTPIPLIFLTGRDNEVDKILGLKLGQMIISLNHLTQENSPFVHEIYCIAP